LTYFRLDLGSPDYAVETRKAGTFAGFFVPGFSRINLDRP